MILTYHNIAFKSKDENTVDIFHFLVQMIFLKLKKYNIVGLDEYDKYNTNHIVLRFDDGYKNIKKIVYPILNIFKYPAEIFICNLFVLKGDNGNKEFLSRDDLKYISKKLFKIQYHSMTHPVLIDIVDNEQLKKEIICPKFIKKLGEKNGNFFAYPYWKYNDKVINIVKKYYTGAISGNGFADNSGFALDSIKVKNTWFIPPPLR